MNHKLKILLSLLAVVLVLTIGALSFKYSETKDAITAFVTARAYILEAVEENCTVLLKQGINLVSFVCETGRPISEVFNGSENYTIYIFNSLSEVNPWRIHRFNLSEGIVQNNFQIRRNDGYIIVMDDEFDYTYDGLLSAQSNVQLRAGWNLVPYLLTEERTTTNAFSSISSNLIRVETYEDNTWKTYVPFGVDQIQTLKPMSSYWIRVNQDIIWSIS
jgi:hypothetical protein